MDSISIINVQRFSTLTKLCDATIRVLEFIHKCRKGTSMRNHKLDAMLYLVKSMQEEVFGKELEYLRNPHKGEVPKLVVV